MVQLVQLVPQTDQSGHQAMHMIATIHKVVRGPPVNVQGRGRDISEINNLRQKDGRLISNSLYLPAVEINWLQGKKKGPFQSKSEINKLMTMQAPGKKNISAGS